MPRQATDDLAGGQRSPGEVMQGSGLGIGPDISTLLSSWSWPPPAGIQRPPDRSDRPRWSWPSRGQRVRLSDWPPPRGLWAHDAGASMTTFWDLGHRYYFQRGPPADRSRRASRRVRPTRPVGQTRGVEADITSVPTTGSAFRCVKSEVDGHLRRCPAAGTWVRQNLSQLHVIFSGARIGREFGLPTGRVHLMAPGKDALVAEVTQVVPERDASALRCHAHSATPWATPARRWTRPMRP